VAEELPADLRVDLGTAFFPVGPGGKGGSEEEIRRILALTGKNSAADELNCGHALCLLPGEGARGCPRHAEVEMCLPYLIARIEKAMKDLRSNQAA